MSTRKIAITTGGGDAPGLNAVIQSAVVCADKLGWEVYGIRDGYDGILQPDQVRGRGVIRLSREDVENISHLGGTILGTSNRGNPFKWALPGEKGEVDRSDEVVWDLERRGIDAMIVVGGDGSLAIAQQLVEKGVRIVGVPKTIDNDLESTVLTFGFDTAVSFATECIDRLHSTAASHRRILVVEVMGRYAGWIAIACGIAGRAEAILIPEIPYDINKVAQELARKTEQERGREHAIVVVAEGAKPVGGEVSVRSREAGRAERLGGIGEQVAVELQALTGKETRAVVLGHLLRGGSPTAMDRMLGLMFGAAAVRGLQGGQQGVMVALNPPKISYVPLKQATRQKAVPLDGNHVTTARALDISLGD